MQSFYVVTIAECADNDAGYVKAVHPHGFQYESKASAALVRLRDHYIGKGWWEVSQDHTANITKSVLRYAGGGEIVLAIEQWAMAEGFV